MPIDTLPPQFCWNSTDSKAFFVVDTKYYTECYSDSLLQSVPDNYDVTNTRPLSIIQAAVQADGGRNISSAVAANGTIDRPSAYGVARSIKNWFTGIGTGIVSVGKNMVGIGSGSAQSTGGTVAGAVGTGNAPLSGTFNTIFQKTGMNTIFPPYFDEGFNPTGTFNGSTNNPVSQPNQPVNLSTQSSTKIDVYFNTALFNLFSSFPSYANGYSTSMSAIGRNRRLIFSNRNGINEQIYSPSHRTTGNTAVSVTTPASYVGLRVEQEYSTVYNISPITSLVFCSNTLPINPNLVSSPLVFNNNRQIQLKGANSAIVNIITDLVAEGGNYRPYLLYLPQAEYRLISLHGNRPLYNLDLSIFYRTKYGDLIPFRLSGGSSMTIKLAFLKKSATLGK